MHQDSGVRRCSGLHRHPLSIDVTVNHFSPVCREPKQGRAQLSQTRFCLPRKRASYLGLVQLPFSALCFWSSGGWLCCE